MPSPDHAYIWPRSAWRVLPTGRVQICRNLHDRFATHCGHGTTRPNATGGRFGMRMGGRFDARKYGNFTVRIGGKFYANAHTRSPRMTFSASGLRAMCVCSTAVCRWKFRPATRSRRSWAKFCERPSAKRWISCRSRNCRIRRWAASASACERPFNESLRLKPLAHKPAETWKWPARRQPRFRPH